MKSLICLISVLLVSGCATDQLGQRVSEGAAIYNYKKTAEGCEVSSTSARNPSGITVQVTPDCGMLIQTEMNTDKQMQIELLNIIGGLVGPKL